MMPSRPRDARKSKQPPPPAPPPTRQAPEEEQEKDYGPVLFWREYEEPYGFMCQWYLSPFTSPAHPGITFNCAEQYMMYNKALASSSPSTARAVLHTDSPGKQKQLGRRIAPFDAKAWERVKFDVVVEGNVCKFRSNSGLRARLLATGERELYEASPSDRVWGIGVGEAVARVMWGDGDTGEWGGNLLGKALETVRWRLRDEADAGIEVGEVVSVG